MPQTVPFPPRPPGGNAPDTHLGWEVGWSSWPGVDTLSLLKERLMGPARFSRFPSVTTDPAHHPWSPVNSLSLSFLSPTKKPLSALKLKISCERPEWAGPQPIHSLDGISVVPGLQFPIERGKISLQTARALLSLTHILGYWSFWPGTEHPPSPLTKNRGGCPMSVAGCSHLEKAFPSSGGD